MSPKVKQLLLLARKLAPIPGFLAAFGTWGFVFSRYSDPPIDMAGRALAASLAAASASAAKEAQTRAAKAAEDEENGLRRYTPYDGCIEQKALFPQQYGALACSQDELPPSFPWAWAPVGSRAGAKTSTPRPKSSAAESRKAPKPADGDNDGDDAPAPAIDPPGE